MLTDWQKLPETEKRDRVAAMVADLAPYDVELHLMTNPELPKKFGRAIKAAGGSYSEARGTGCMHRYVTLPSTQRGLINTLVREFGFWHGARSNDTVAMLARGMYEKLPAPVAVRSIAKAVEDPMDSFERGLVRDVLAWRAKHAEFVPITNMEVAAVEKAKEEARAVEVEKRKLAEILYAAMPRSLDEYHVLTEALTQYIENCTDEDEENETERAKLDSARKLLGRAEETFIKLTTGEH